jgi:hypothetical protein
MKVTHQCTVRYNEGVQIYIDLHLNECNSLCEGGIIYFMSHSFNMHKM